MLIRCRIVIADEIEELKKIDENEAEDNCIEEGEIINNNYKKRAIEF